MAGQPAAVPLRANLLDRLHEHQDRHGHLSPRAIAEIARDLRLPVAEAWEAATAFPDFSFAPKPPGRRVCAGLSCRLAGAAVAAGEIAVTCRFRCYEAPVQGEEAPFPEDAIRLAGPVLAPEDDDRAGLASARRCDRDDALQILEASGLRGRGGAYFPASRKWVAALAAGRPLALVVNAEEGEPGVFKDRAILGRRPHRFLEGLAIARAILRPALTVIFVNGHATYARGSLEAAMRTWRPEFDDVWVVRGGGGYVLGEETTLLNAIEGRKPVPRLRPPYPVERGLFGLPTVVNNVETIANLPVLFRSGVEGYRRRGTPDAPGTKLLSISGRVARPGVYEVDLGVTVGDALALAGGRDAFAVLAGGPSGGFLPRTRFDAPLLPGMLDASGAVMGSGGLVALAGIDDVRTAALAMARFNAEESCGKCTPCREGTPRVVEALESGGAAALGPLIDAIGAASLCGLGQMAAGPVRSVLAFWPEVFE